MSLELSRRLERAIRRLSGQPAVLAVRVERGDETLLHVEQRPPEEGATWLRRDIGWSGATLSVLHHGALDAAELNDALAWCGDVLASTADVRSLEAARDHAAKQEALLRSVLMTLTDGVLLYDHDMHLVECNESAVRMLGASRIDLLQSHRYTGEIRARVVRADGSPMPREEWPAYRAVRGREWINGELLDFRRRDGQRRWLLFNAAPVAAGAVVSIADLTEFHEARAAAEDSVQTWKALVEALHEGVALFDGEGRVEELNAAAEAVLGVRKEEVTTAPRLPEAIRALDEQSRPVAELPWQTARQTGRPVTGVVLGIRNRRGGLRWYLTSAIPLPDGRVVSSIMDFTSVKSAALEIEQRKDEFISTLSHEMRTPLTSLAGALALLETGAVRPLPPEAASLVQVCSRSAARLTRLVNDVLDLERILGGGISLAMSDARVADLIRHAVEAVAPAAARIGVEVVALDLPELTVATDQDRVAQILGNYLANAVQQSKPGSRVEVSTIRASGQVRIAVRDYGPGVPPPFRPRLFTRFAQADPSAARGGAGLGLSICKALAQALGGEVGFEPPPGGGSTFWLSLPVTT
jgi:PAS domain S-box-containing protein